ncbi:hypothetical protein [Phaffia rhodozyma]|uniref:Uncharacterized protein n=1 Tax=Phaffia rhodozyma TaxID=264483 RepID=A0A0F7SGR2_PHARH|nr:hypothetical protein [Phaffia rhodozyma]
MATKRIQISRGVHKKSIPDELSSHNLDQLVDVTSHTSRSSNLIESFYKDRALASHPDLQLNESSSTIHFSPAEDPLFDELLWNLNTFPALAFPILKPELKHHPIYRSSFIHSIGKKRRLSDSPLALAPPATYQVSLLYGSNLKCPMRSGRRRVAQKRARSHQGIVNETNLFLSGKKREESEADGFAFLRL